MGYLCTCARAPPSPYLRVRVANCAKIWCVARDPVVTRFTRVGGGVTNFARACPVSLSRKQLSPGTEATSKTDLSLSRSLVHRQTWRLTGYQSFVSWSRTVVQSRRTGGVIRSWRTELSHGTVVSTTLSHGTVVEGCRTVITAYRVVVYRSTRSGRIDLSCVVRSRHKKLSCRAAVRDCRTELSKKFAQICCT